MIDKRPVFFLIVLSAVSLSHADTSEFFRYSGGMPRFVGGKRCALSPRKYHIQHLKRKGYDVGLIPELKSCAWVAYSLTPADVSNRTGRVGTFARDIDVPSSVCSPDAYWHSGYDRGHMAPSQDMQYSEAVSIESFYMGNIMPQTPRLNRGAWKRLETRIHKKVVAEKSGEVEASRIYVMMGPIFSKEVLKNYESAKNAYMKKNEGAEPLVKPDKFWKVFRYSVFLEAVIMDQCGNARSVSVKEISDLTGLSFFSGIDENLRNFFMSVSRPMYGDEFENEKEN